MKDFDYPEIIKKASAWHNNQSLTDRKRLCISSAHEQWMQLERDKVGLRRMVNGEIKKMTAWQKNIEASLRETMIEVENEEMRDER